MLATFEQIFPFVFAILWLGGSGALYFWTSAASRHYLGHFPAEDGVPLDMYHYIPGALPNVRSASAEALKTAQDDPALESLRQTVWRRVRYTLVWGFGFPACVFCVLFTLGLTGHLG